MVGRPTWTDCDEAGDYVVPNVLSPRDLVFRPDNMDETVPQKVNILYLPTFGSQARELKTLEFPTHNILRWRSGAVVRASDFGPKGPWFEPRPVHISLWP